MWSGFDSRIQRDMWVKFVVGSVLVLALRVFPLGTLTGFFLSPQKPTFPNSIRTGI